MAELRGSIRRWVLKSLIAAKTSVESKSRDFIHENLVIYRRQVVFAELFFLLRWHFIIRFETIVIC